MGLKVLEWEAGQAVQYAKVVSPFPCLQTPHESLQNYTSKIAVVLQRRTIGGQQAYRKVRKNVTFLRLYVYPPPPNSVWSEFWQCY